MTDAGMRILAVSALWQGANDHAFVRAFRRAGHSVSVVSEDMYLLPDLRSRGMRALRRLARPMLVRELNAALVAEAETLRPDLFFVFKGVHVRGETVRALRRLGAVAVNFYPDVSFTAHGPYIPEALPHYDCIFSTKSFGIADMRRVLGVENVRFLPHGFDPETHVPTPLGATDIERYGADVSFIGTWSPKKEALLRRIRETLPEVRLRVWGGLWDNAAPGLSDVLMGHPVIGTEYAKAIGASAINLAILSESRRDSSSGDVTTSRTFHIPASGGFMLHERNDEALSYFAEGEECAYFGDSDEMLAKIAHYLANPEERRRIAAGGRARCLSSDYSIDSRARAILARYEELSR